MAGTGKLKAKVSKPSARGISGKRSMRLLTGLVEGASLKQSHAGNGVGWSNTRSGGKGRGKSKGSMEEWRKERELRRRVVVCGWRQGEGLGGEWELGRLVVPAEVGTRWQHGSSLGPPSPCLPPCAAPHGHPQQSALTLLPGGVGTRHCLMGIHSLELIIPGSDLNTYS